MKSHFSNFFYIGGSRPARQRPAKPPRMSLAEREARELAEIAMTDIEWITQHRKATA